MAGSRFRRWLEIFVQAGVLSTAKVLARIEGTQKRNRPFQLHVSDRTLGKLL